MSFKQPPPKFRKGQMVVWGNGVYRPYWITDVYEGQNWISHSYRLSAVDPEMKEFVSHGFGDTVSESVLRALRGIEFVGKV